MPPKPKFTRERIIEVALDLVSESGIESLTARELGVRLGSSARPLFTVFDGMDELQAEVCVAAVKRFENFVPHGVEDMPYFKQVGMKMIFFGLEYPKLYRLLFMRENESASSFEDIFGNLGATAVKSIKTIGKEYSLSEENAKTLFEHTWIHTFGIGALCATGACVFSREQISQMLTQDFTAMLAMLNNKR